MREEMKELQIVIASGSDSWCSNCEKTADNLKKVLNEKFPDVKANIDHINITKPDAISKYGTLLPPSLIINDTLIVEGKIPSESIIEEAFRKVTEKLQKLAD